jgi:glycosyltransferase involved in cell wall biosynthesis
MPKVSIIIPVFNVEPYLRECLDSVRAQTFTDWECICVDDGSTDASPAILDEYAAKDPRFRVIRREHSNAGACRNVGMDEAKGEFLSFLDSDDVFSSRMLEIMLKAIEKSDADISTCGQIDFEATEPCPLLEDEGKPRFVTVFEIPSAVVDIYSKWRGQAWDKLFRHSFVDENRLHFQELRSTNDVQFTFAALCLSRRVCAVNRRLVAHRINPTSLVSTYDKSPKCMFEALCAHRLDLVKFGVWERFPLCAQNYKKWCARILISYLDKMKTPKGYESVHNQIRDSFHELGLHTLAETDISPELLLRLKTIGNGCTPLESSLLCISILSRKVNNHLHDIHKESLDYKIGHIVLVFPRFFYSLCRRLRTRFSSFFF